MNEPALVPELSVTDIDASLDFWCRLIGFSVRYSRPEENFAYITLGDAHIMLDQIAIGRTWLTAPAEKPLGRGINFEVVVPDYTPALERLRAENYPLFVEPETQWYRTGDTEIGVQQFLVQDPDGYLLRLQMEIGTQGS
ncbi:lactoylglutathione lyase-like lyase [Corynebacterium mustelae]|uniref:Bleomycin resistance protein n=1 Tax=Corynebacterium mustelae TaxID=571915 RepID=A0A0G3H0Y7_9CORY|nr:VOC family protein [Corynebacterium mustelae]AKK05488.1 lactoylglutathione lyase-like lyase [Corynebacterium mustelae]